VANRHFCPEAVVHGIIYPLSLRLESAKTWRGQTPISFYVSAYLQVCIAGAQLLHNSRL
jgi:hypothetical protein